MPDVLPRFHFVASRLRLLLKPYQADGIAGVVCGRALYEGTLDFKAAVAALA